MKNVITLFKSSVMVWFSNRDFYFMDYDPLNLFYHIWAFVSTLYTVLTCIQRLNTWPRFGWITKKEQIWEPFMIQGTWTQEEHGWIRPKDHLVQDLMPFPNTVMTKNLTNKAIALFHSHIQQIQRYTVSKSGASI